MPRGWAGYETEWVYRWIAEVPDDLGFVQEEAALGADALREAVEAWAYGADEGDCPPLARAIVREFLQRVDWDALREMVLDAVPDVPSLARPATTRLGRVAWRGPFCFSCCPLPLSVWYAMLCPGGEP